MTDLLPEAGAPPGRMRGFNTSKPWLYAALRALDAAGGRLFARRSRPRAIPRRPRKILVANIAHLGDALLSTGVPGALKRAFPDAEIHFLISSRAATLVAGNPAVSRVHLYDSLLLNWPTPPLRRLSAWLRSLATVLPGLRRERYDLALDLRAYFPNALPLLALARPGCLVGFGTAGFRFLLDHEVGWRGNVHEIVRFQDAVETIADGAGTPSADVVRVDPDIGYLLLAGAADSANHTRGLRAGAGVAAAGRVGTDAAVATDEEYVVLHPGTRPRKRWPDACWRRLAASLREAGRTVVVTGTAQERPWLAAVFGGLPVTLAAGATSVADLARIFRRATLYVGVDSFASHLAALAGTSRVVVIWNRFADPVQWAPVGAGRVVIVDPAASPTDVVRSAFASAPPQRNGARPTTRTGS